MAGERTARRDPDVAAFTHMVEQAGEARGPRRMAGEAHVQPDAHHSRSGGALLRAGIRPRREEARRTARRSRWRPQTFRRRGRGSTARRGAPVRHTRRSRGARSAGAAHRGPRPPGPSRPGGSPRETSPKELGSPSDTARRNRASDGRARAMAKGFQRGYREAWLASLATCRRRHNRYHSAASGPMYAPVVAEDLRPVPRQVALVSVVQSLEFQREIEAKGRPGGGTEGVRDDHRAVLCDGDES